ncbi:MAG TPA: FkbM family methyltransferase [Puia sp.]|jgi:FkbM family methyltransferase|nr:FkbM family methyltransferase [Puia sp.]
MGHYSELPAGAIIAKEISVFNKDAIKLSLPGQTLIVHLEGDEVELDFLQHPWSGIVEIHLGKITERVQLFSEKWNKLKWKHTLPEKKMQLVLTVLNVYDKKVVPDSSGYLGNEVWVAGITCKNNNDVPALSVKKITEYLSLVKGKYGDFMVLNTDLGISKTIIDTGAWAEKDINLFKQLIKPGFTVCDIGANIGHHTVVFSSLAGKDGRVYAFEPQEYIFRLLNTNLLLNDCDNARAFKLAVGNEKSQLKMWPVDYKKEDNFGALGISQVEGKAVSDHPGEMVDVVSGDEFLSDLCTDGRTIDFIKIDVQTFELYVLQGLTRVLQTSKPALFLEVSPYWMQKTGYHYSEIYQLLFSRGYKIYNPHSGLDNPITEIPSWDGESQDEWDIIAIAR